MKHSLTLLLLASLCCHANADGVIRDALGARTAGRGGTNIAFADAGMILHDNPAGMINLPGIWHAEFGADVLISDVVYSDPDDRDASASIPIPLGNVAIIRKSANQCLAYGIGCFTPGGFATSRIGIGVEYI